MKLSKIFSEWRGQRNGSLNADSLRVALADASFAAMDIEVTGTDVRRDQVLGVAIVPVEGGTVTLRDVAYLPFPGSEDVKGIEPRLMACVGARVVACFRESFLVDMLDRAFDASDNPILALPRIDLAVLLPEAFPEAGLTPRSPLDKWLAAMDIEVIAQHRALADAYALAQALLVMLPALERQGVCTLEDLMRLEHRIGNGRSAYGL